MKYLALAFFFIILLVGSAAAIGFEKKLLLPSAWIVCFYMMASRFMGTTRFEVILVRVLTLIVFLADSMVYILSR